MKKFIKSFAISFVTILISLLVAEVIVRIIAPQQLIKSYPIMASTPKIGYRHKPDLDVIINKGEGPHHLVTDHNGYRINRTVSPADHIAPADISILNIGDSFVEDLIVENEQTIPGLLGQILSHKSGKKVESVNAGVGGWGIDNYYLEARSALALQKYDLGIIYIFLGNDISDRFDTVEQRTTLFEANGSGDSQPRFKGGMRSTRITVQAFLGRHSHLYWLIMNIVFNLRAREGKTLGDLPPAYHLSSPSSPLWHVPLHTCELIAQEFTRYQTPVVFVLLPPLFQINATLMSNYIQFLKINPDSMDVDQPNKIFSAEFAKLSITLLDPTNAMRQKLAEGVRLYGKIDPHLNVQGNQVVADYISPYIEEMLRSKLK